ncbi:MAG: hypothetical protein HPM95_16875 [Alphaproteobacteria bacterium]|nr:hypothetical protein [Alphaproteobacteria bacterium]
MAEACLNAVSDGSLRAFSAGLAPASHLAPATARVLAENGIPCGGLVPKPWELFRIAACALAGCRRCADAGVAAATGRIWAGRPATCAGHSHPAGGGSPIQQARDAFATLRREISMRFCRRRHRSRRVLRRSA